MEIYFVAHAITTDNEKELSSGWKDVELSELGIKQAKELRNSSKDFVIFHTLSDNISIIPTYTSMLHKVFCA